MGSAETKPEACGSSFSAVHGKRRFARVGTPRPAHRYLRRGGVVVEYPMNYFRPLIAKWSNGLRGKTFPRQVTAANGTRRWQAATGRSYLTFDEASNP